MGSSTVAGSGNVLYGEAVDWRGNPVTDADGKRILYPRVGKNNGSTDDLPVRLDKEGIPQYDESQLIRQEDQEGNETGNFSRAYSTIREIVIDGQVKKVPVGYIETYKPLGAGAYVLVEIQAPEGYVRNQEDVYSFTFSYTNDSEAKVTFTHTFVNERVNATIKLQKKTQRRTRQFHKGMPHWKMQCMACMPVKILYTRMGQPG